MWQHGLGALLPCGRDGRLWRCSPALWQPTCKQVQTSSSEFRTNQQSSQSQPFSLKQLKKITHACQVPRFKNQPKPSYASLSTEIT
uniref:Uncharacterized protein n=1 Tax=Arundo donax TaxID=35708 RepID=A0A0A9AB39_ARUDO